MKTILITGINGFLGSHLAKSLSVEYNIIGLEYSVENLYRIEGCGFKVYSSKGDMEQIFKSENIFAVIHAATIYRRNESEPLEGLINTNILLPIKLFEFAKKNRCQLFINTDTFFNDANYNYSYLPDYTLSKKHVLEWIKLISGPCKLINMKIFHMYGPNDSSDKFIPYMINSLKNNNPSLDLTQGEQIRDFIYIDDVVSAYKCILKNETTIDKNFEEYNVGTGKKTSIKELLVIIKELTKSVTDLNFGKLQYRDNEIMNSCAEIKKLCLLGWSPNYNIYDGIQKILKNI